MLGRSFQWSSRDGGTLTRTMSALFPTVSSSVGRATGFGGCWGHSGSDHVSCFLLLVPYITSLAAPLADPMDPMAKTRREALPWWCTKATLTPPKIHVWPPHPAYVRCVARCTCQDIGFPQDGEVFSAHRFLVLLRP